MYYTEVDRMRPKKSNTSYNILLIILIALIIVTAIVVVLIFIKLKDNGRDQAAVQTETYQQAQEETREQQAHAETERPAYPETDTAIDDYPDIVIDEDRIEYYDDGDAVYQPPENVLVHDDETQTDYYNNLILVYLNSDLSEEGAQDLAVKVQGVAVGRLSGAINTLQIAVEAADIEELEAKAALLMEEGTVSWAGVETAVYFEKDIEPWGNQPWDEGKGLANEADPAGNDWWVEAIGAYTAWQYKYLMKPVSVGIVDSGFDTDHEDLVYSSSIPVISMINSNTESNHGTHVAGLIVAQENGKGIRGIVPEAEQVICADWERDNRNLLCLSNLNKWYKDMVEEANAAGTPIVINKSWGGAVALTNNER